MKKDVLINLRVNKELKLNFQAIVEREGFTMSQVLEASMLDIVRRNLVPINLQSKIKRKPAPIVTIPFIKKCVDAALAKAGDERIQSVSLFGSYSRGTANASSDIDLFLDVEEGYSLFDLADLQEDLEHALGKKVDLVTRKDDEYFMKHIQREQIKLYERVS